MNSSRLLLSAAAALLALSAFAAPKSLLTALPPDAFLAMVSSDPAAVREKFERTPFARTWEEESIRRFTAPLRAKFGESFFDNMMRQETGFSLSEVVEMSVGPSAAAVVLEALPVVSPPGRPPGAFVVTVGGIKNGAEYLARFAAFQRDEKKATVSTEEIDGVAATVIVNPGQPVPGAAPGADGEVLRTPDFVTVAGLFDGLLVQVAGGNETASSLRRFGETVGRLKRGGASFAGAAIHEHTAARAEGADVAVWFNFDPLAGLITEDVKGIPPPSGNPMQPNPEAVLRAARLDAFSGFYTGVRFGADSDQFDMALHYRQRAGIFGLLLHFLVDQPAVRPEWVPAEVLSFQSSTIDFGAFWDDLLALATEANPVWGGVAQGWLAKLKQDKGIDLRADVAGNLAGPTVTLALERPAEETGGTGSTFSMVNFITLRDPARFNGALEALKGLAGPEARFFEEQEFAGEKIFVQVAGASPAATFAYAVVGGMLLATTEGPGPLRLAIQGMKETKAGGALAQPAVRRAWSGVPERALNLTYVDGARGMPVFINLIRVRLKELAETAEANHRQLTEMKRENPEVVVPPYEPAPFDFSVALDFAAIGRLWGPIVSFGRWEGDLIVLESRLAHPVP